MKTYAVTCPECNQDFPAGIAAKWGPDLNGQVVCDGCRDRTLENKILRRGEGNKNGGRS